MLIYSILQSPQGKGVNIATYKMLKISWLAGGWVYILNELAKNCKTGYRPYWNTGYKSVFSHLA